MIVVLLGPPGAGKGTQGSLAAASQGWIHLSTGDLLREEVARETPLGREARTYMDRGDLVPDALMVDMVARRLREIPQDQVLLLDGFPRTLAQAEALEKAIGGGAVALALYFHAPETVLTARLMGRGRSDDSREVVERRLAVYRETTEPLVAWYRDRGLLREIDADRPVSAIQEEMIEIVRNMLAAQT